MRAFAVAFWTAVAWAVLLGIGLAVVAWLVLLVLDPVTV